MYLEAPDEELRAKLRAIYTPATTNTIEVVMDGKSFEVEYTTDPEGYVEVDDISVAGVSIMDYLRESVIEHCREKAEERERAY